MRLNKSQESTQTSLRKNSHLEICLNQQVESHKSTRIEDFEFVHHALSDTNFDEIDISTTIWGKKLDVPLIAAAMSGGHPKTSKVNELIAATAHKFNFAMGVGSQRAAIEKNEPAVTDSFRIVRQIAPDILLIGNLGAAQFSEYCKFGEKELLKAVELIKADVFAIHVNLLQEIIQPEGDRYFKGFFKKLDNIAKNFNIPIILKEVGSGFSIEDARLVQNSSFAGIDIGGLGGTSWAGVETIRAEQINDRLIKEVGNIFWDWGIPTAISVVEVRSVMNKVLIATGGVRNGLQAAKLIALGADIVGIALPFLKAANEGEQELDFLVNKFIKELKTAMFLSGCKKLSDLKNAPLVVSGYSKDWLQQRGLGHCLKTS